MKANWVGFPVTGSCDVLIKVHVSWKLNVDVEVER